MTNRTSFKWSLVGMCAVLAIAATASREAIAAKSPEAKCRGAVAGAVKGLVSAGLKALDSCHKRRDKSGSPADCNELDGVASVQGALVRGRAKVTALCQSDNPVLVNYPDGTVGGINDKLLPAVIGVLEESGRELQGAPTFSGDKATLKKLRKCHGAIGKGRTVTVGEIFKVSSACQKRLDKNAPAFSSIAPECVASPGGKSAGAIGKLGQSCSGIDGATVGSCTSLPDCVASAATADGQLLSRLTFGGPTECGNGVVELGEDCDDGNTVDGDACPATCGSGECGNGVREGDEACDDGAGSNEDACLNTCEVASCGDGYVQEGVEECDDAAPPEGAVCAACQLAAAACGADGLVQATVELELDEQLNPGAEPPGTLRVSLDYPDIVQIPGSADAPEVVAAVSDLTGVGFIAVNDDDAATALTASYLEIDSVNPPNIDYGAIFRVQFQGCPNGTPLRPADFPCTVIEVSDDLSLPVEGVTCRVTSLAAAGTPPTTTTSTTSSSTSTVTSGTSGPTTTSTTIVSNDVCGNGMTVPPETCDDSNSVNTDNCPSDCIIDACAVTATPAGVLTVTVDNTEGANFGVVTVFVDYPEGLVLIPGFGDDSQVQGAVTGRPTTGAPQCTVNDREHGLSFGCFSVSGLSDGQLFQAAFRDCGNGGPPALGNFTCTVVEATSPLGAPVNTTCTLSLS